MNMSISSKSFDADRHGTPEDPNLGMGFYALVESIPQLVWTSLVDGSSSFQNRSWREFTGLSPDRSQSHGWLEAIHPEDRSELIKRIGSKAAGSGRLGCRIRRASLTYEHFEIQVQWMEGGHDAKSCRLMVGTRLHTLEHLPIDFALSSVTAGTTFASATPGSDFSSADLNAESHWFRRLIPECSMDCIKVLDLDGNLLAMNPQGRRAMEIDDYASLLGKPWLDFWAEEGRETIRAAIAKAKSGKPASFWAACKTFKGTLKWWDVRITLEQCERGRPEWLIAISRDITERINWEQQSRQSKERFRATLDNASVGIAHVAMDGRFLRLNDRICEILGYKRDELMELRFQDVTHPDDLEAQLNLVGKVMAGECKSYLLEKRYFTKEGETIWASLTATLVTDDEDKPDSFISIVQDITAVKVNEERLRLVASLAGICIAEVDYRKGLAKLSPETIRLFGLQPTDTVVSIGHLRDMMYPEDRERNLELLAREICGEGDGIFSTEFRIKRPDGQMRHISSSQQVIRSKNSAGENELVKSTVALCDITGRKSAEAALRVAEEGRKLALKAGKMGVWDWDVVTGRVTWSDTLERILGMEPGSFQGTLEAYRDLVYPDDRGYVQEQIHNSFKTGPDYAIQSRMRHADGSYRWIRAKGEVQFHPDGSPARLAGVCWDITDVKHVEDSLRNNEEHLRALLDGIVAFVWMTTADGTLIHANKPALIAGGLTEADVIGKAFQETSWFALSTDAQAKLQEMIEKARQGKPCRYDTSLKMADNNFKHVDFMLTPIRDTDGNVRFLIPSGIDIDERKRAGFALEEADKRKNEFLAMLAHELRNPLAAISNALYMMRSPGQTSEDMDWAQEVAERQLKNLVRLIDELLDISRIASGKIRLKPTRIDASIVAKNASHAVLKMLDDRKHNFHVTISSQPMPLFADSTRLDKFFPTSSITQPNIRRTAESSTSKLSRATAMLSSGCATQGLVSRRTRCRESSTCSRRLIPRSTGRRGAWGSA